jgi:hypothetical protein
MTTKTNKVGDPGAVCRGVLCRSKVLQISLGPVNPPKPVTFLQPAYVPSYNAPYRRHDLQDEHVHGVPFRGIEECSCKHSLKMVVRIQLDEFLTVPSHELERNMHPQIVRMSGLRNWDCFHEGQLKEAAIAVKGTTYEH